MYILGFDIGGTKCAVITAAVNGDQINILKKLSCPTDLTVTPEEMIARLFKMADEILETNPDKVGISCGGPLDSEKGVILGPPNLKGWDRVEIVEIIEKHYGVKTKLNNDANACAIAEWKFGAGRGTQNMVFMTFGTGLGAGLILNGKLYPGTNGNAGELGHIRLAKDGPIGYGKKGSFEGFCSGGGLAQLGYSLGLEALNSGLTPLYFKEGTRAEEVSAKTIADAARAGDETALKVFGICAEYLGRGLSVIIDILNPQVIVIGSIFARCQDLLYPIAEKIIKQEALLDSASCCKIVPAELGEQIGDYGAVASALLED